MGELLLSWTSAERLSAAGFNLLLIGLAGDVIVFLLPTKWHKTEKVAGLLFTLLVFIGVYVGHIGDDATLAAERERANKAEAVLAKVKTPRTLSPTRQKFVADAVRSCKGQEYSVALSQAADDGIDFWQSLFPALEDAGWAHIRPGPNAFKMGNPPAGVAITAAPGVEIVFDPSKESELAGCALALGNALHADGMVVAVNRSDHVNPNESERTIFLIRIGARVPPP